MKVAIVSPSSHSLQHRVRGTGFYIKNLGQYLEKYAPECSYFFGKEGSINKDIDVIHYPYFEPFFLTLPFLKKVKTVVTVHDLTPLVFPDHFPKGIRGYLKWQIQKLLLKRMDAVITDSESSKRDILKFTGIDKNKIKVIHLSASENFKKVKNPQAIKYNLPESFVLYVGDVTWNKNLPRLIKAVKKINLPLVLVGKALADDNFDKNNPWNKDLLEIQKLTENDKKIIRPGFVSDKDLLAIYNRATVFAMPSLYEGFGLPALEAMACGCPVVTSRMGSIPEIAGEAAFYVDPNDVDEIAEGIKTIFSNKSLSVELSRKGLEQSKKFSWEKTVNKTVAVYRSIL